MNVVFDEDWWANVIRGTSDWEKMGDVGCLLYVGSAGVVWERKEKLGRLSGQAGSFLFFTGPWGSKEGAWPWSANFSR